MEIISVINQKGGVGKSTIAQTIAIGLVNEGKRVLFIDFDAQGNSTSTLPVEYPTPKNAFSVLIDQCDVRDAIQHTEYCDIIPSSSLLSTADLALNNMIAREYQLQDVLKKANLDDSYDFIIFDTPPSLGFLTINTLTCSDSAIIPAQADEFSLQGIRQLYRTITNIQEKTNHNLKVRGIVLNRFNGRTVISKTVANLISKNAIEANTKLYNTKIRECTAFKEAQLVKKSIFDYAPNSNAAKDMKSLIKEILEE